MEPILLNRLATDPVNVLGTTRSTLRTGNGGRRLGRLAIGKREGEEPVQRRNEQPLTFILSPSPGERRDRALHRFRVWDAGEQAGFSRCPSQSQSVNQLRRLRRSRNGRPRTPGGGSLILRAAEAEDREENDSQKSEAKSEAHTFAEAFGQIDAENYADNEIH